MAATMESACVAAQAASAALLDRYDVGVELWSATSYKALRENALAAERWNRLHPTQSPRTPLGTDGMGRSDTREALRRFFEIDEGHVVVAVLHALAGQGQVDADVVSKAINDYGIDPDAVDPYGFEH